MEPKVFIVFPIHNKLDATKRFLDSLKLQSFKNYVVIICDDGSTDGSGDYLRNNSPVPTEVIDGNGTLWWTAGINRCINKALLSASDSDFILTINNDVTLPSTYIEQKINRAYSYPDSIIGSLCVFQNDPDRIETSGHIMDWRKFKSRSLTKFGEKLSPSHSGITAVTHLCAKGVLIPVKMFREIGLYDEENFPQYHADTDFTLRAYKAGYKILLDYDSRVFSDVNLKNIGSDGLRISIRGFLLTFKGKHSLNNFSIIRSFAQKHFPGKTYRYLLKTYFFIVGGFVKRYFEQLTL